MVELTPGVKRKTDALRADYLLWNYRAQLFKNSHNGAGFRRSEFEDELEAKILTDMYQSLAERALQIDHPKLDGKAVFSLDYWKTLGYPLL